jgi:hypothetical protein
MILLFGLHTMYMWVMLPLFWRNMLPRPDEVNKFFSIYLILQAALGPEVYSASNRNEYQKQKKKVSWEYCMAGA